MLVGCPACKTRYRVDATRLTPAGSVLCCSRCRTFFRINQPVQVVTAPPRPCAEPESPRNITVLVANESPDFCGTVSQVLADEPFTVFWCHNGQDTLAALHENKPDVVLLDVALPGMYGFEICDYLRVHPELGPVRTILIASIYDKTRYKREPQSLYGADDYIEKHHIPDSLAAKIYRLVLGQEHLDPVVDAEASEESCAADLSVPSPGEMEEQERVRREIRQDEQVQTVSESGVVREDAHEKARRLARIIVADIALYNQERVEAAVKAGTFSDEFAEEILEGSRLYEQRVPSNVRQGTSYLAQALTDFLALKQSELGLEHCNEVSRP